MDGFHADHFDIPINEKGRQQAGDTESLVISLPIQTVCFSPMKRAKKTKEILAVKLPIKHCESTNLKKYNSSVWSAMTAVGPEAPLKAQGRVQSFMKQVKNGINHALSYPDPVLIIAHGDVH